MLSESGDSLPLTALIAYDFLVSCWDVDAQYYNQLDFLGERGWVQRINFGEAALPGPLSQGA